MVIGSNRSFLNLRSSFSSYFFKKENNRLLEMLGPNPHILLRTFQAMQDKSLFVAAVVK